MRTDFDNLMDGDVIVLHPREGNLLHKAPIKAVFQSGFFYCEGTNPFDGPDYYLGDVLRECEGFTPPDPGNEPDTPKGDDHA